MSWAEISAKGVSFGGEKRVMRFTPQVGVQDVSGSALLHFLSEAGQVGTVQVSFDKPGF